MLAFDSVQVYRNVSMQLHSATLQHKPHKPTRFSEILFASFKANPESPSAKRIERMLSLLVAADRYTDERDSAQSDLEKLKGESDAFSWAHKYQASKRAYIQTLKEIEKALEQYQWRATVSAESDKGHFQYELCCIADPKSGPLGDWEGALVARLLELTKRPGAISRFRRCSECHEWFYATTGHQRFCGDSCRRRQAAQDPEFKEKRATYMRETYRPREKKADALSRRQAAQVLSGKSKKGGK